MNKKTREPIIKTKRLVVRPMSDEEIVNLISETTDEELKTAYLEMQEGALKDPENRIWYAPWGMYLKKEGTFIGDLCFKGPVKNYSVEIGYGIHKEFEGRGYTTEACQSVIIWALDNPDIYYIEAETDPDNKASQRILEKLEFVPDGQGKEGPRFSKEKPKAQWMSIYMCFGLAIGLSIGTSMDSTGTGLCLGMCIGLAIGAALDSSEKKRRKEISEKRAAAKAEETEETEE